MVPSPTLLVFLLFLLSLSVLCNQSLAAAAVLPVVRHHRGRGWPRHDKAPAPGLAIASAPWELLPPRYGVEPMPKPLMKACVRTPFPDLCACALSFRVDPKQAGDMRKLAETSTRVAIESGAALASFGYVHLAGARNNTRMLQCVRDCTVRVDAAVKDLSASAADPQSVTNDHHTAASSTSRKIFWTLCLLAYSMSIH